MAVKLEEVISLLISVFYAQKNQNRTGVINDPLSQTHSLASSKHCFRLKIVLFCYILKSGDVRMDVRT